MRGYGLLQSRRYRNIDTATPNQKERQNCCCCKNDKEKINKTVCVTTYIQAENSKVHTFNE